MVNIKISIIIPVLDGEKTLGRCLDSLIKQTYGNYEIIVVDNNSIDGTKEIIDKFGSKSNKIRYIFEPQQGRSLARNAGINNSSGDIIAMLDSDCVATDDWLEEISKPIINDNESIVMGSEKEAKNNYWSKNIQDANSHFNDNAFDDKYINHIDTKNFAIKKALMKKYMFDESLKAMEDFDLYLRLKKVSKVRFLKYLKVAHFHKDSLLKYSILQMERGYWVYKIYKKYIDDDHKNERMFQSVSLVNNLMLPLFLVKQLIKKPDKFIFCLVSELSWRAGIIKGIIF